MPINTDSQDEIVPPTLADVRDAIVALPTGAQIDDAEHIVGMAAAMPNRDHRLAAANLIAAARLGYTKATALGSINERHREFRKAAEADASLIDPITGEIDERPVCDADAAPSAQMAAVWQGIAERNARNVAEHGWPRIVMAPAGVSRIVEATGMGAHYVPPHLEPMNSSAWHTELTDAVNFRKRSRTGWQPVFPNKGIVTYIEGQTSPPLDFVSRITNAPVCAPRGELITAPGLDAETGLVFIPQTGVDFGEIPAEPSYNDVRLAWHDLVSLFEGFNFHDVGDDERLTAIEKKRQKDIADNGDFYEELSPGQKRALIGHSSRANAIALMLLPFVREVIDGPTPATLITKSVEGAGATLLANVCYMVAYGLELPTATDKDGAHKSANNHKDIAARLMGGAAALVIDNAEKLTGRELASFLTSNVQEFRPQYSKTTVTKPVRLITIVTGTKVQLSREMADRCCFIQLVPQTDKPRERTDFAEPKLLAHVRANRGTYVRACLTLVQNWIARGRPSGSLVSGSFVDWAAVMSGVMDAAASTGRYHFDHGPADFMTNHKDFRREAVAGRSDADRFVQAIWDRYGATVVRIGALMSIAAGFKFTDVNAKGTMHANRKKLEKALAPLRDRIFTIKDVANYEWTNGNTDERRRSEWLKDRGGRILSARLCQVYDNSLRVNVWRLEPIGADDYTEHADAELPPEVWVEMTAEPEPAPAPEPQKLTPTRPALGELFKTLKAKTADAAE